MKKLFSALIITCLGTILIGLNTKEHNPPLPEAVQPETSHVEAVQEPIEPVSVPEPIQAVETLVEAPSAPVEQVPVVEQTINQAEANVVLNPVGCANYRHLVEQYDWDVSIAMAVMQAESGCNPGAENWSDSHGSCSGSKGLFQLACFWPGALGYSYESLYDPASNVAMAYQIYKRGDSWRPWGAYTNGSYSRYL